MASRFFCWLLNDDPVSAGEEFSKQQSDKAIVRLRARRARDEVERRRIFSI